MINYKQLRMTYKTHESNTIGIVMGIVVFLTLLTILTLIAGCAWASSDVDMTVITEIESGGNVNGYNRSSHARGLCQITPVVLAEYDATFHSHHNVDELYIGQFNLLVGDYYMNFKIPRYLKHYHIKDTVRNRLIAYNCGIRCLVRNRTPPKETIEYVLKYEQAREWRNR